MKRRTMIEGTVASFLAATRFNLTSSTLMAMIGGCVEEGYTRFQLRERYDGVPLYREILPEARSSLDETVATTLLNMYIEAESSKVYPYANLEVVEASIYFLNWLAWKLDPTGKKGGNKCYNNTFLTFLPQEVYDSELLGNSGAETHYARLNGYTYIDDPEILKNRKLSQQRELREVDIFIRQGKNPTETDRLLDHELGHRRYRWLQRNQLVPGEEWYDPINSERGGKLGEFLAQGERYLSFHQYLDRTIAERILNTNALFNYSALEQQEWDRYLYAYLAVLVTAQEIPAGAAWGEELEQQVLHDADGKVLPIDQFLARAERYFGDTVQREGEGIVVIHEEQYKEKAAVLFRGVAEKMGQYIRLYLGNDAAKRMVELVEVGIGLHI